MSEFTEEQIKEKIKYNLNNPNAYSSEEVRIESLLDLLKELKSAKIKFKDPEEKKFWIDSFRVAEQSGLPSSYRDRHITEYADKSLFELRSRVGVDSENIVEVLRKLKLNYSHDPLHPGKKVIKLLCGETVLQEVNYMKDDFITGAMSILDYIRENLKEKE